MKPTKKKVRLIKYITLEIYQKETNVLLHISTRAVGNTNKIFKNRKILEFLAYCALKDAFKKTHKDFTFPQTFTRKFLRKVKNKDRLGKLKIEWCRVFQFHITEMPQPLF